MATGHRKVIGPLLALLLCAPMAMAQDPAAYDQLPDDRVLYIAPGQSLSRLVERLYPERPGRWAEIRGWIVSNNPHAFVDGDPDRLRADVRVKLPSASEIAAADPYTPDRTAADADTPSTLDFADRYVFVDPAQSLAQLVPRLYPDHRQRWDEIIGAILERNAERLADMDRSNRISRGTRLQIPEAPVRPAPVGETDAGEEEAADAEPPGPVVAEVISRDGSLHAVDAADRRRPLETGDGVRRGDTLHTGEAGRAEIEFRDGEQLFLRPDSRVRVRDWRLPDTGPGTRIVELLEGGLRAVTGAIGNRDADTYRTVAPQATLGIRGTEYALRLCADGACRAGDEDEPLRDGLYVGVDEGRISLLNETGETTVDAGGLRYVAGPATAPAEADPAAADVLYTAAEQVEAEPANDTTGAAAPAEEEEESSWGWIVLGIVLLGAAL